MSSIVAFATQGEHSLDHDRLCALLAPLEDDLSYFPFDPGRKAASAYRLLRAIRRERPDLAIMEGTGVAGGSPLLLSRALLGTRYVVVSGDAVGPYIAATKGRAFSLAAWLYEALLLHWCDAFIGWTPYLVGRALTFGARRAITAQGWAPQEPADHGREEIRTKLGIPEKAIVFGIVGSLHWTTAVGYTYGAELVRAVRTTRRSDIVVLIVGDGSGLSHLRRMAREELGKRVLLVGRVARSRIPDYLSAFDIASLPQSCDQLGAFRYSTKLPEYVAAGLPIITGQLPMAYDLVLPWSWRLPGPTPWSDDYVSALGRIMSTVTHKDIAARKPGHDPTVSDVFSLKLQQERVQSLIQDLLASRR
jgi:glycosyltransferase involved in cell wall biosynthesis